MSDSVTSAIAAAQPSLGSWPLPSVQLQCPDCRKGPCRISSTAQPACLSCGFTFSETNGVYNALPQSREAKYIQFVHDYELVRSKEGRGSDRPDYYLALPFQDLTGRNAWQWGIRARTFRFMERKLLPLLEGKSHRRCDVLDIGAGNGWLSYRLALRGHRPVAVDLLNNDTDGLGAARHYFHAAPTFTRFKAEMDCLPFMPEQFDVVIFNASFHYSEDYTRTLEEALRCLRRGGHLMVADSPFYRKEESGKKMLHEKRAAFERQYGFRSDSIQSREYLTAETLQRLAVRLHLKWQVYKPWYGINWAFRPIKAKLTRRREPSKFYLLHAQRDIRG